MAFHDCLLYAYLLLVAGKHSGDFLCMRVS